MATICKKLTYNQSSKNKYGKCLVDNNILFYKQFSNEFDFLNELNNYETVKNILNCPKRYFADHNKLTIYYEYINQIYKKTIHYSLYSNNSLTNLNFLNNGYNYICDSLESSCKNSKFFKDRTKKILDYLEQIHLLGKNLVIGTEIYSPKHVLIEIYNFFNKERMVPCIISQGDPTDVNILNDGTVIDLETAGKNSLCADVAIFINAILINSYYFFVKYSSGEHKKFKRLLDKFKNTIDLKYTIKETIDAYFKLNIPNKNKKLVAEFINKIKEKYDSTILEKINQTIKYYLCFRLLTPMNWNVMSEEDLIASICLVCITYDKINSLDDIINTFC
ncbi:MAG: hypothetical protein IJA61_04415 [Clostridia bacterium]|nr:hypothetical protein [Clostridia bacterium]